MLGAVAVLTLLALQPPPPPPLLGDPADDPDAAPAAPLAEEPEGPEELKSDQEDRPAAAGRRSDREQDAADVHPAQRDAPKDDLGDPGRRERDDVGDDDDGGELNELYETPKTERRSGGDRDESAPRARARQDRAPAARTPDTGAPSRPGGERPVFDEDVVPPADPLQETLQVDAGTYLMHVVLSCAWAVFVVPVGCVPCLSWVLYPGAVGIGIDQVGRYLTNKRGGGALAPGVTFLLVELLGTGLGVAAILAATLALSALATGSPELTALFSGTAGGPPVAVLLLYGGFFGVAAATGIFATAAATAAWHIAARDDRGDALFDQLNPFDQRDDRDDGASPRRTRRQAALDTPVSRMRY